MLLGEDRVQMGRARTLTVCLLLAACSAPADTTPLPSMDASAPASGTAGSAIRLIGDGPVLNAADLDGKSAVLPGALVIVDGTYHAFLVGFGDAIGDQRPFHATSPDGVNWAVDEGDPLEGIGLELADPGAIPTSVLIETDGSWTMYIWGRSDPAGVRAASVWRATATAAAGPWVADPEPVLTPGVDAWDSRDVDFPSVVRTADGYLMAYTGVTDREIVHIGLATSTDGIAWTKLPEPIISPGHCGGFDDRSITIPRLIGTDAGYLIVYLAFASDSNDSAVGVSTSADGVTWTCASPVPLLERADVPGSERIHTIALAQGMGRPQLLVESLVDGGSELWLAELIGP